MITIDEALRAALREELDTLRVELRELVATKDTRAGADDYMTVADAAALARVHPCTIREWIKRGLLDPKGPKGATRIRRDDLHAAMESRGADALSPEQRAALIRNGTWRKGRK